MPSFPSSAENLPHLGPEPLHCSPFPQKLYPPHEGHVQFHFGSLMRADAERSHGPPFPRFPDAAPKKLHRIFLPVLQSTCTYPHLPADILNRTAHPSQCNLCESGKHSSFPRVRCSCISLSNMFRTYIGHDSATNLWATQYLQDVHRLQFLIQHPALRTSLSALMTLQVPLHFFLFPAFFKSTCLIKLCN